MVPVNDKYREAGQREVNLQVVVGGKVVESTELAYSNDDRQQRQAHRV
jgi:threonyl-tRNA synthetase